MSNKEVMVFIDNSNVFKYLESLNKVDKNWCKAYDPQYLAKKLVGDKRKLKKVLFYCSPPPKQLLKTKPTSYKRQMSYYNKVEKLDKVEVKYGTLTRNDGVLSEKNLDTQLIANLLSLVDEYDDAIIVSNDGDYVSGVEGVKLKGKKVENAYFRGSLSMDLKRVIDVPRRLRQSYFKNIFETEKEDKQLNLGLNKNKSN